MLNDTLPDLIRAAFSGIYITTSEPDECANEIWAICKDQGWEFAQWDLEQKASTKKTSTALIHNGAAIQNKEVADPIIALQTTILPKHDDDTAVFVYHNLHHFLKDPMIQQCLFNRIIDGNTSRQIAILLAPTVEIPIGLQKHLILVNHDLPTKDQLSAIAQRLHHSSDDISFSINAAAGLTRYEAEGAFALSLARKQKIDPEAIWEIKAGQVKKSGLLTLHRSTDSFDSLGGLAALKTFAKRSIVTNSQKAKPKGLLLLGVPGTGKSQFAKCLGSETGQPTLIMDIGSLKGSLVGQSEANMRQALSVADAMAPCILFVDELEKALAGATGQQGDSGVSAGILGSLLTWLNDHQSQCFFIGTCNDISKLPPEFSRAERFDAIFFLDIPSKNNNAKIWDLYQRYYDHTSQPLPQSDNWTGAEIKACCRIANMLNVSLIEAARYIVPVAVTSADKISELRNWASNRCLDADKGDTFTITKAAPVIKERKTICQTSSKAKPLDAN